MKQPYYEQEERKLLVQRAEQESQRPWAPTGTLLGTARLCVSCFEKKNPPVLIRPLIQVNTVPNDTHALVESSQETSELVLSCAHFTDAGGKAQDG